MPGSLLPVVPNLPFESGLVNGPTPHYNPTGLLPSIPDQMKGRDQTKGEPISAGPNDLQGFPKDSIYRCGISKDP